jgi:hypothetical protein
LVHTEYSTACSLLSAIPHKSSLNLCTVYFLVNLFTSSRVFVLILQCRFGDAGSPLGCAAQARFGAEPNEHGTWYFGRDGWCDGQDVRPHVWDVTSAVLGGPVLKQGSTTRSSQSSSSSPGREGHSAAIAIVEYRGFFHTSEPPPADGGGEILLSSNIVFYSA